MASLLRQIVAGPRARHPEAGLDLCYVTDRIIATSGPSGTYPKRYYRTPLDQLISFLDKKHGENWAIWEFRAEGTGYPDDAVYNRIWHFPWPDHHPPPFALIPDMVASMRDWLNTHEDKVVVVHCKAGKGRSGTASCSYMIAEENWELEEAIQRFTERRMKPGWGAGVSIPSQLRWLSYVDQWTKHGKKYVERRVEVCEVHVWGLRDGVIVGVQGFAEEGKVIKTFHQFTHDERTLVRGEVKTLGFADAVLDIMGKDGKSASSSKVNLSNAKTKSGKWTAASKAISNPKVPRSDSPQASLDEKHDQRPSLVDKGRMFGTDTELKTTTAPDHRRGSLLTDDVAGDNEPKKIAPQTQPTEDAAGADAIFRPRIPLVLDTNEIEIDIKRRTKGAYTWAVTTSIAHVWFNTFFEGRGPELSARSADPIRSDDSGVFEIEWAKMDGIKGSYRKGTRAFDRLSVVWKVIETRAVVAEPREGEAAAGKQMRAAADWRLHHGKSGETDGTESEDEAETYGVKAHVTQE